MVEVTKSTWGVQEVERVSVSVCVCVCVLVSVRVPRLQCLRILSGKVLILHCSAL